MGACGGGKVGETLRPKEGTASNALKEETGGVDVQSCAANFAEPLVVDIKSSDRADFEASMKEGVAVVRFDCRTLKLLKNCSYPGRYGFVGVERNEDVVRMAGKDEVAANLPVSGAKLGAEMQSGSTLDLALITVGKRRTTVREVLRKDLEGDCESATHVVKGAYIGAFAFGTGTVGKARAVAELFGAGVGAQSVSDRQAQSRSGDIEACRKSSSDASDPPPQCGAITRLELMPLAKTRKTEEETKAEEKGEKASADDAVVCPNEMVWTGVKCAPKTSDAAKVTCDGNDGADCLKKCQNGGKASCESAAYFYLGFRVGPDGKRLWDAARKPDEGLVQMATEKGCELGGAWSCYTLAGMLADKEATVTKSLGLYKKACDAENANACMALADMHQYGNARVKVEQSPEKAMPFVERGCKLGLGYACVRLARAAFSGQGMAKDVDKGIRYLDSACSSGRASDATYCDELANVYFKGEVVPKDEKKAISIWERGCKSGGVMSCYAIGSRYQTGSAGTKDPQLAKAYYERACSAEIRGWPTCFALGQMYEDGDGVPKDYAKAVEAYERILGYKDTMQRALKLLDAGGPNLTPDANRAGLLHAKACERAYDLSVEPAKTSCAKGMAILDKRGGDEAKNFYATMCMVHGEMSFCTKAKKYSPNLASSQVENLKFRCQSSKQGRYCKAWKLFGGTPSAQELAYPEKGTPPPGPKSAPAKAGLIPPNGKAPTKP
jgi:hypothetical protein